MTASRPANPPGAASVVSRPRHPAWPWVLRAWRLTALAAAAGLIHLAHVRQAPPPAPGLPPDLAREFFPAATRLDPPDTRGVQIVRDDHRRSIGSLLTTSPETDDLVGYSGPNNLLVALDADGRIAGLRLLWSRDTEAHVQAVLRASNTWSAYLAWRPATDPPPSPPTVSGSTLTTLAIAEGLQRRLAGVTTSLRFPEPLHLGEIQSLFPAATTFRPRADRLGRYEVLDARGQRLGEVLRTSPHSDNTRGYGGPTEALVALAPDGQTLTGLRLRHSYDTPEYVDRVREDAEYLAQLCRFTADEWATLDLARAGLEGVSGATQTSYGVAESLRRRFAADHAPPLPDPPATRGNPSSRFRDVALATLVVAALGLAHSPWRGHRRLRRIWQIGLVLTFGLWLGDLLSVALFVGWSRHGPAWHIAPSLVFLAIAALLTPWATRRQVYCHHLCPHGAVQEWLGRRRRRPLRLPPTLHRWLSRLPPALLALAFLLALTGWTGDLARLEPFDAWAWKAGAVGSAVIAVVGLAVAPFVPMGYCHYGCPTGALLRFLRSSGHADRPGPRDLAALILLAAGAMVVLLTPPSSPPSPHPPPDTAPAPGSAPAAESTPASNREPPRPNLRLGGTAFGTAWNITLRRPPPDPAEWQSRIQAELDRIEGTLSHWRPDSATAHFNAARTIAPQTVPPELLVLVSHAALLGEASEGAFDPTIAPLAALLGLGPKPHRGAPPSPECLARTHALTGWRKLRCHPGDGTLAKADPGMQLDLGALLQGYAADRITALLRGWGAGDCLVDVGGELLATGSWVAGIEDPCRPGTPCVRLSLRDEALSTSGVYRGSIHDSRGRRRRHILDPRTGDAVRHNTLLVAVIARRAVDADGWSTALLVLGGDEAVRVAEHQGVPALVVTPSDHGNDLTLRTTRTLRLTPP